MKTMISLLALVAMLGTGCKKKQAEEGTAPGSGQAMGSAMGSAEGSGSAAGSAATKPMTPEELAKRYEECWGFVGDAKWDDFQGCFAADAVEETPGSGLPEIKGPEAIVADAKGFKAGFPDGKGEFQLELINGHNAFAVVLMTGTNSGAMKTPMGEMPATNKKIGFTVGHLVEFDDAGKAAHLWDFRDDGTMLGQLQPSKDHPVRPVIEKLEMPKVVVIAKDDDAEKANLATDKQLFDAFNKHDIKAISALVAADATWSSAAAPADIDQKANVVQTQGLWKAFSDLKLDVTSQWAAGDYVVTVGTINGTNDGDMKMMKLKKTGKKVSVPFLQLDKLEGGKIKASWIYYQAMTMMQQLGVLPPPGAAAGSAAGSAAK